jgi:ABC-type branched-subunit amino acid transport system substrate-binding protein
VTGQRQFPPGVGWIPVTIAVVAALVASTVAIIPQFRTRVVGTGDAGQAVAGGPATDNGGGPATGPGVDSATGGSGSHFVAGTRGSQGSAGTGSRAGAPGSSPGGGRAGAATACAAGQNGGNTAPGVSASEIDIATTDVTTGVGSGFLGEATQGMQAALNEVNSQGGICGRRVVLTARNDGWNQTAGQQIIQGFVNSNIFALVGEPDSEGLYAAVKSGTIDHAQIPVVGTDGMLSSQYYDQYIWPVAASTVSNMHIIAQYAVSTLHANSFGIVYDTKYKFGAEGAAAFAQEVKRLGHSIGGAGSPGCTNQYCGVSSDSTSYSTEIKAFNSACAPCDVVVMLLEPAPMVTWMQGESGDTGWYRHLMGGEPLFDDNLGSTCGQSCNGMMVWTGYHPAIQPFDSEAAVSRFAHSLKAQCSSCDTHNEFTEGAYLGTRLFIAACQKVGPNLTRPALQQALASSTFDLGLSSGPLQFPSAFPRVANTHMAAFSDNASGSFNGWNYDSTGFLGDPAPTQDYQP